MNKPIVALVLLVIALFAYSVYQFFDTHEYKEVTEYTPFKGEARDNPLFAARLFLKEMGIPAINKNDLQSIGQQYPDTQTVIILDTQRSTLSQKRTEQLLAWVRKGGHLITPSSNNWTVDKHLSRFESEEDTNESADGRDCSDEESNCHDDNRNKEREDVEYEVADHLQQVLEVSTGRSIYIDADEESGEKQEVNPQASEDEDETDSEYDEDYNFIDYNTLSLWRTKDLRTFPVVLSNAPKKLKLSINPYFYAMKSKESNESRILIEKGIFLLQRSVGKGMITLTADLSIIENQLLRETDNAEFLWYLVHSNHQQPNAVWLFHNDEMPNLMTLMWRYGWTVILSLTALLFFWLYQSTHRFGPLIPKQPMARRRLIEHIDASGDYFWKENNKQVLIDSTRLALNQRIARLHPTWDNTDEQGKVVHLAEMLSLPTAHIKHLLFNNRIEQDEDFRKLIAELEAIRRQL